MEDQASRLGVSTPVFDKKEKRNPVHKKRLRKHSQESFRDSVLANELTPKRDKKKSDLQHLISSPLDKSELSDESEKTTPTSKRKNKKRKSALRVDKETGVVYVLVDKENIENMQEHFKSDVDVVYINKNKEQESTREPEAKELDSDKSENNAPAELHTKVKKKKSKKCRTVASCNIVQEVPSAPLAQPQSESHAQGSLFSDDLEGEMAQLPVSADRKKSRNKKRKVLSNQAFELMAEPETVEDVSNEGSQVISCLETAQGNEPTIIKTKSKKRKRGSSENDIVPGDDPSVHSVNSMERNGALIEEATSEPQKEKTQVYSKEGQRLESVNEENNLESVQDSEAKYVYADSEDSDDSDVDLGSAVKQLQEFIPDIKDRASTTIKRMYRDDLQRFKEFKAQGVAIKFGKFSEKENKQLEQNVQEFLDLTGIENADKLLYTDRYPEEKATITNLKRKYSFRVHIGKGIARPWKLVYYRAKKMFDVNNYKGRYSKGEAEKVKIYHSLHGNDWKKIGNLVARSSLSVALKFSQISSERNHGAWSKAETQKLIKAVEEVILKRMSPQELNEVNSKLQENPEGCQSIVREKLYKGISWVEVEAKVETRNWMQCKSKWSEILTKRMTNGQAVYRGIKALQAKINLIERLYEVNVEDANQIDWEDLASTIGDVPPSYVQTKFYKLKATCVPFWQKKTFPEIIDYLYERSLPQLKEKLKKQTERKDINLQSPAAPKQVFLFTDIFYHEDDSEGEDMNEKS